MLMAHFLLPVLFFTQHMIYVRCRIGKMTEEQLDDSLIVWIISWQLGLQGKKLKSGSEFLCLNQILKRGLAKPLSKIIDFVMKRRKATSLRERTNNPIVLFIFPFFVLTPIVSFNIHSQQRFTKFRNHARSLIFFSIICHIMVPLLFPSSESKFLYPRLPLLY